MANQIEKTYMIDATPEKVWDALTVPVEIDGWGAGTAKMSLVEAGEFSLWGGDIYGKNLEIKPPYYLRQEWFGGPWQSPSVVEFRLSNENGKTKVKLAQNGVPEEEVDDVDNGWDEYYLGAIKGYLEL